MFPQKYVSFNRYKSRNIIRGNWHSCYRHPVVQFSFVFTIKKKMDVLKKIDESKPYFGFTKLGKGFHQIVIFRTVKNKFDKKKEESKSILVELKDQVVFLPQHFRDKISDSDIMKLNSTISEGEDLFLHFDGKNEVTG